MQMTLVNGDLSIVKLSFVVSFYLFFLFSMFIYWENKEKNPTIPIS